jgi:hypothetical protein
MVGGGQDHILYKELLELLSGNGTRLFAVLKESGHDVPLPGLCRLTPVEGHAGGEQHSVLLIGTAKSGPMTDGATDHLLMQQADGPRP